MQDQEVRMAALVGNQHEGRLADTVNAVWRRAGLPGRAAIWVAVLNVVIAAGPAAAQAKTPLERVEQIERQVEMLQAEIAARNANDIAELRRQLDAVVGELEEIRLGRDVVVTADTSIFGMPLGASKVYQVERGVSIGGYGENLYENFSSEREDGTPAGTTDQFDALRAILYVGYKFDDRILFNSEIEFEHATTGGAGSASFEFGYLDYRLTEDFGFRAGLLLPPMGFVNELHEPPTFLGTERPLTEQAIIPSTWRENGIGVFGATADFDYRFYLINGMDAVGGGSSKAGGFSASGLRGGRQKGSQAVAEDFAGVGRIDYTGVLGLLVGGSFYLGESGQNNVAPSGKTIGARTLIVEGHGQYKAHGFDVRSLYAFADVADVDLLNAAKGLTGSASIGEQMWGAYLQVGYDALHGHRTDHQVIPYVRLEKVNTQSGVPAGFSANPATERSIVSLGAAWKPIPSTVLKLDYQIHRSEAKTGVDQFNANMSWLF